MKDKAGSTEFLKDDQSKKPEAPEGFKPKAGEKVLAVWATNSWYQAKVEKVTGVKATVAWEDGSNLSEVAFEKVAPLTTAAGGKLPEKINLCL